MHFKPFRLSTAVSWWYFYVFFLFNYTGNLKSIFLHNSYYRYITYALPMPCLLLPMLDYADTTYLDITEEQLNKLACIQNWCIRFLFGLRKYDHISDYRKKLKWLLIHLCRNTHILTFLYCILFNPASPSYLRERWSISTSLMSEDFVPMIVYSLKFPPLHYFLLL